MSSIDGQHLSPTHREQLTQSAISDELIEARGYRSITNPRALPLVFTGKQRDLTGLLFPVWNTHGETGTWQLKPDAPRDNPGTGKSIKYETPAGSNVCIDVPTAARPYLLDADADLWITEGAKKVDSSVSHGIPCTIGLLGVSMWQRDGVALPDWKDIALKGRRVIIAFDSDVMTKPAVRQQLVSLAQYMAYRQATVAYCILPVLSGGAKCGLDDAFASGLTRADLEALVVDSLPGAEPDWPEPIPLDDPAGPDFPLDALPGTLGRITRAVAASTQTPPGMAAVMALGTISAAARGRYTVAIPEHDWSEPVLIQAVVFALPGERKSAVVKEITAPLSFWEREQRLEDDQDIQDWMSKRRVLQKQLDAAENAASKGREPGEQGKSPQDLDLMRQAATRELGEHDNAIIHPTRIIADDVTPEKAKQMIVEQEGALAIISAEGTFFAILAGRYSDSPSLEVMLNGHAGEPITVDRKSGPALSTPRGYLTIAVACQPHVAETMGKVDGFQARGGAARILPAFVASAVGNRSLEAAGLPADLRQAWDTAIRAILNHSPARPADSAGYPTPCRLMLDAGAYTAFQRYRAWHEPQLQRGGELGDLPDWGSKLPGAILRKAGLLHLAIHDRPEDHLITADTIDRAVTIGGWFAAHARIMYRVMAGRSGQSDARQVLDVVRELGTPTTKREIHRTVQNRTAFQKADDLTAPLALLEEYGWIRTEREGKSTIVNLNPLQDTDNSDNGTVIQRNNLGLSLLSLLPRESKPNPPPDIAPAEPLQPTGTDGIWREEL